MKKLLGILMLGLMVCAVGCHTEKESDYDRYATDENYERFLEKYVFAACSNANRPQALYSLASLRKRPANDDPRYKVTFVNGPCEGKTVWTTDVILKTEPIGAGELPRGTTVLRNYWNPQEPADKEKTDRWHIGVVSNTSRLEQGIVDVEFPRDRNDFNPAREGVYLHNVRYIVAPKISDVRTFIH